MALEKMARFVNQLIFTRHDEPRGPVFAAFALAGAVGGFYGTTDWAEENWDTRPQAPSSAYVETFNQKATDVRALREDIKMLAKRAEINEYDAKRSGKVWRLSDEDIVKKYKLDRKVQADEKHLWAMTVTNTDLKEVDLGRLMTDNRDIFNGYSNLKAERVYAVEECQIETKEKLSVNATLIDQAKSIAQCGYGKTSSDELAFLGALPGAAAAAFGVGLLGAGAGSAASAARRRKEKRKNAPSLNRN